MKYNQSPLPFQGQKRRFLKQFKGVLEGVEQETTFVDLFGGSGLLSHTVKELFPEATVVWNDYDNFQSRLENVKSTNQLLSDIRKILMECPEDKRVEEPFKSKVLDRVKQEKNSVDYITLSGSLLFSGKYSLNYDQFSKETFYNKVKKTDYTVDGYLDGVKRVQCDYQELFASYKDAPNVIFLIDPPYLSTDSSSYSSDKYWKLKDYLNVLDCLEESRYFYFTSSKSNVLELCEWVSTRSNYVNPFAGANRRSVAGSVNYASSYEDIMVYKIERQ